MKIYEYKDIDVYLSSFIDIFSTLNIDEPNKLAPREKEFLIEHIKLASKNIPLLGKEANLHFSKKRFQTRTYRKNLKKKGWIIQTKDGIVLAPVFDIFKNDFKNKLKFNFTISYNETGNS